ncbi:DUF397 domain-containing protein [Nonomuraea sp. WAC 01424]|uniref:DUF397 domain-containing protein n=1 Tax=Nonomuraea sp. WAC 01424 TaxID=2203200 RepID=UPI000F76E0D4|nr:DUF397 domain-containing protein [Nonomuraea sp. WAC 01424]RSN14700.1 DUF397 domain-containing protein [Nonomuraea sp. WAC 01424]
MEIVDTDWKKSPFSGGNGNCVELRRHNGMIEVRDSKDPAGPILSFTDSEILAFRHGLGSGAFDEIVGPLPASGD